MTRSPEHPSDPTAVSERDLRRENQELWVELEAALASERELRRHLAEVHGSRLWRLAQRYWAVTGRLGSILRSRWLAPLTWPFRALRRRMLAAKRRMGAEHLPELEVGDEPARYDLIVLPIIDWHFRFQRPQQLASRFADAGHRVFYARGSFRPSAPILGPELRSGVWELELPGPLYLNIHRDVVGQEQVSDWMENLDALRQSCRIDHAVVIVQIPFWSSLALAARQRWGWKVVYDCMDDLAGFSTNSRPALRQEDRLISQADLTVVSSQVLFDKVEAGARRTLLVRNGTDFDHFHSAAGVARGRGDTRDERPLIGYYGAISDWFDLAAVERSAQERPEWSFVLIGRTDGADVSRLAKLDNVHLPGERPYLELPSLLAGFDVCLIPFERNRLTLATNPVKFYEYLSAGKPVVATDLPELEPHRDLHYPVREGESWVDRIEAALAEEGEEARELQRRRHEVARANTWEERHSDMAEAIVGLHGVAAIIIVSYNNLEYLRQCLDSVARETVHPRYRVVVVDNGSGAEVEAFLLRRQKEDSRIQVILNRENLGFPRANNIGIDAAGECDYVVLLNDDTVVTRGWLLRMLGHLDKPGAEVVGPVSNWCGNEARIEVGYGENLDEMRSLARARALHHEGETFDIRVLAMYCIVIRRDLIDRIGPLDERFGVGMFEDDDFARRVRQAGGRLLCAEDVFIHHWGRSSFAKLEPEVYEELFNENKSKYEEKWGEPWQPHQSRNR